MFYFIAPCSSLCFPAYATLDSYYYIGFKLPTYTKCLYLIIIGRRVGQPNAIFCLSDREHYKMESPRKTMYLSVGGQKAGPETICNCQLNSKEGIQIKK